MIRVVNRIAILSLLSLALTGCLRDMGTAPIQPSPPGVGVQPTPVVTNSTTLPEVTAQPTNVLPSTPEPTTEVPPVTTEQNVLPTNPPPPTAEPTTEVPTATTEQNVLPTNPPPPTDIVSTLPVLPTELPTNPPPSPTEFLPTNAPSVAPTKTPLVPTQEPTTLPVATLPPSQTPFPLNTPTATSGTRIMIVTATATLFGTPIGPPPTAAPPQDGATGQLDAQCMYHVEQGDRLLRIALRFNRTMQELVKANPEITNSQLIYLGQTIKIPDCKTR